jgi:hypothetical protein
MPGLMTDLLSLCAKAPKFQYKLPSHSKVFSVATASSSPGASASAAAVALPTATATAAAAAASRTPDPLVSQVYSGV